MTRSSTLDTAIAAILEERKDRPALAEQTPQQARAASRSRPPLGGNGDALVITETTLELPGRSLAARIYAPRGTSATLIAFFHGGGFVTGDLDTHDGQARMLAEATGRTVASIDYRLAPEHPFPAAYDDAVDSVRYLHEHGGRFRGDAGPATVAVAGSSAGANIAAGAALALAHEPAAPTAQLLVYPLLGGNEHAPSRLRYAEGFGLTADGLEWYLGHYLRSARDRDDSRFAPLLLDAGTLSTAPPAVISAAGLDPLHDDATTYAQRLASVGVPVDLLDNPTLPHAFWGFAGRSAAAALAAETLCRTFAALLDTTEPNTDGTTARSEPSTDPSASE